MAFTVATAKVKEVFGGKRVVMGKFSGGAPTSGTVATGLVRVDFFFLTGATASTESAGTMTVTSTAEAGYWIAIGR